MEILIIIGIVLLVIFVFTAGGVLGWLFKGLGYVFDFLLEGWGSCLRVLVWIILIVLLLLALAL